MFDRQRRKGRAYVTSTCPKPAVFAFSAFVVDVATVAAAIFNGAYCCLTTWTSESGVAVASNRVPCHIADTVARAGGVVGLVAEGDLAVGTRPAICAVARARNASAVITILTVTIRRQRADGTCACTEQCQYQ